MIAEPFCYLAYGLSIHADRLIPGLRPAVKSVAADVRVTMRGSVDAPSTNSTDTIWYVSPYTNEHGVPAITIYLQGTRYLLHYSEGVWFGVSASGSQIDAWWDRSLTDADAADYLLGGVIAFVLRGRGMVPLHASAIVIDGHAVLFAGAAGAGKSTTASACALLGIPVLSDDVVAVGDVEGAMVAYPSQPRMSLWSDSAGALFPAQSLPTHSAVYPKHSIDLVERGYRFHDRVVPIDMIFVLGDRRPIESSTLVRVLTPRAALMTLVTCSYANYLIDASMRAREFDLLGRLVTRVPVSELSFGSRLEDVVQACRELTENWGPQFRHE